MSRSANQGWKDEARDAEAFDALGALYRFRVSRWRGLLYIGETGRPLKIRFRFHWQHYEIAAKLRRSGSATRTLAIHRLMATLAKKFGGAGRFEVSWTNVSSLVRDDRKGVEAELLAAYRAVMGRNPNGQWGGEEEDSLEASP
jgi:hypothetical protein